MTTPIVPTGSGSPAPAGQPDGPVDPAVGPAAPARRRHRGFVVALALLALGGVAAAVFLVQLPYYVLQPGSVRPAEERIQIEGAQSFDDDGEVLFTTVLMSRATPALMVRAWLDDAMIVRSSEEVYPEGDVDGVRQQNLQRMDLSKLVATRVALDHVGIDARFDANGARVLGLSEQSPSQGKLGPGDVILEVDEGAIGMPADIGEQLSDRVPGDEVAVVAGRDTDGDLRPDAQEQVRIVLGSDERDGVVRPVLGVEVEPFEPVVDSEVAVSVDSGEVTGPSAGLAWTLGIIDRLTPGALTGGRRIAVTGEIFDDGTVGAVGGVVQKVSAVRRAGIELFIYPASTPEAEQREMRRIAGDAVELAPVATIDEAVEVLSPGGVQRPD